MSFYYFHVFLVSLLPLRSSQILIIFQYFRMEVLSPSMNVFKQKDRPASKDIILHIDL